MPKGKPKYANLVQPLRLGTRIVNPSFRGKLADLSHVYDGKEQSESKSKPSRKRSTQ